MKLVPRLCSTDAQIVMMEEYETHFGIFNHDVPGVSFNHPFAVVEMHSAEDIYTHSILRERMKQFAHHKVGHYFNISWNDYLRLPAPDAAEVMEISAELRTRDENSNTDLLRQLAAQTAGTK